MSFLEQLGTQANLTGFGLANSTWPAAQVRSCLLDELAKMLCGQPSRFV